MDEASLDHAQTLRGLAGGVFRGLHEAPALEAGAAALEAQVRPDQDGDAAVACGLDALASDGLRWAESEGLVRDAARRLRRPAPKVLAEAWAVVDEDGKLVLYRVWDDEWQTWHTGGVHNAHGVGVCMAGWYASRHDLLAEHAWARPTEEAMISAEHLVDYLADRYRLLLSVDTLASHAELGKPACPGDYVENWVREKRGDLPLRQIEQAREDARPLTNPKQIQLALVELGYNPGEVDGFWGPFTANALRAFQTSEGIRADGIFGPVSRMVMRQALAR